MDTPTLGSRVAALRALCGCTTQALADAAGVSRSIIGFLENGDRTDPRASTIEAIAATCGVSTDWLISGIGQPPSEESVRAAVEAARSRKAAA